MNLCVHGRDAELYGGIIQAVSSSGTLASSRELVRTSVGFRPVLLSY